MPTDTALTANDFAPFFAAVHGYAPFPWQAELARRVLDERRWPALLDLPTGAGKTAALDVAVFTLAATGTLPRRVVFVVDRRVVVDQAAERASRLAEALAGAEDRSAENRGAVDRGSGDGGSGDGGAGGVLARVRDALRVSDDLPPLHVALLRGGIPRDDSWAARPDQPTIVLSTVDQVGSRLLFRGYGVSRSMAPVHAGLLGADTLFLLDEVHLSRPFADTLAQVRQHLEREMTGGQSPWRGEPRWQVVEMSATPGQADGGAAGAAGGGAAGSAAPFRLTERDRDPEVAEAERLVQRLTACKEARLVDVRTAGEAADVLPEAVASRLRELDGAAVAVVVNRVATARRIAERLGEQADPVLLTGRMRPLDRDDALARFGGRILAGRTRRPDDERVVVVATQSIEAGADFDFDAMITEVAPLDSLRQRFGRLDRLGELAAGGTPAQALVLAPKATVGGRDPDPVYGESLRAAYTWLKERHGKEPFDAGAESADLAGAPVEAVTEREPGPLLLSTHVDQLVQTAPRPRADPPVASWLHGFADRDIDVSVVWRADLTDWHLREQREAEQGSGATGEAGAGRAPTTEPPTETATEPTTEPATEVVAACPPASPEAMQVPLSAVRAWLRRGEEQAVADVEGAPAGEEPRREGFRTGGRTVLRWRGTDDARVVTAADLRPGDTVVVPADYGGVSLRNWDPGATEPVADLGDHAQLLQRRVATLRLDPAVLPVDAPAPPDVTPDLDGEERDRLLREWLARVAAFAEGSGIAWLEEAVRALAGAPPGDPLREAADAPLDPPRDRRLHWVPRAERRVRLVLSRRLPRTARPLLAADDFDGSDVTNSFLAAGAPVLLRDHCEEVGALAERLARRCGVPERLAADLRLAGELHDLGKADRRFQRWLHDGDEIAALAALADGKPVAKSAGGDALDFRARERARRASRYPKGARHELASVALVEGVPELAARAHDWDLVLHLVASHHGHCRPLAPVVPDRDPVEIEAEHDGIRLEAPSDHGLERVGSGVADRFWRMVRTYGWWHLAWLEAILRLADHRRSQYEQESGTGRGTA